MKTNLVQKLGLGVAISSIGASAMAAGPDFTELTAAADLSSASTAVMAVAAGVIVVLVAIKGYRLISKGLN